jgi:L-methionine (R)-S-oxide reductase
VAEDLKLSSGLNREEVYTELIPQVQALMSGENDLVANLANISAALKEAFNFLWVGFYLVKEGELVLGPYQGPVACTRIQRGKGVCGAAWQDQKSIIVPNVDEFPGHIACSSFSKSEIVLPLGVGGKVKLILDVDSDRLNDFSKIDEKYLNKILMLIEEVKP